MTPSPEPVAVRPTTIIVVRHGETVWNQQRRWQGWLDSPLTDLGVSQARKVAAELRPERIDAAYSSDAGRARQTADIIAAGRDLPVATTSALRERYYGYHEGLTADEIDQMHPNTRFRESRDTRESFRPPGGETFGEARARLQPFLESIVRRHPGETVLLVTHSGIVRLFDSIVQGQMLDAIWHRHPPNCCVYILRAWPDGRFEVVRDHMDSAEPAPVY
jgi:broad specificity phosphatase PhoE